MKPLQLDKPLDGNLKPVKDSDGTLTALQVSIDTVRVKNLRVSGTAKGQTPTSTDGLATKGYVDDTALMLTGGTMSGDLNMADNSVGFTQFEPTYHATDTNVNFNDYGNKAHLTFLYASTAIVDVHLFFPDASCNCTLLIKQHSGGGGSVTNWKTWDQDDGNESTVVWPAATAPTLTVGGSKIDIISFYWDNDNHKAYGVASLNF